MADNQIGIRIETTADLAGIGTTKTALDDLGQRSVPQLTNSLKTLSAQAAGLTAALAKPFSPVVLKQFQTELDATNAKIAATKEEIAALAAGVEETGVKSKTALEGMRGDMMALRSTVRLAFAPIMVVSFIEILASVPEEIRKATDALMGFGEEEKKQLSFIQELNDKLTAPRSYTEAATQKNYYQKKVDDLKNELSEIDAANAAAIAGDTSGKQFPPGQYMQVNAELEQFTRLVEVADKEVNSLAQNSGNLADQWREKLAALGDEKSPLAAINRQRAAAIQKTPLGVPNFDAERTAINDYYDKLYALEVQKENEAEAKKEARESDTAQRAELRRIAEYEKEAAANNARVDKQMAEAIKRDEQAAKQHEALLARYASIEATHQVEDLTRNQEAENKAGAQHEQLTQRVSELDEQAMNGRGSKLAYQLAAATEAEQRHYDALEKMYGQDEKNAALLAQAKVYLETIAAQKRAQLIDAEASKWESFYDRNIRNAKSFADVMKNIWNDLQSYFEKQVFRGILGSIYGQQGAGGGSSGNGGLFGSILGKIFGVGASAGSAVSGTPGTYNSDGSYTVGPGEQGLPPGMIENFLPQGSNGPLGISGGGAGAATAQQAGIGNIATGLGLPPTTPLGNILSKLGLGGGGGGILSGGILATVSLAQGHSPLVGAGIGAGIGLGALGLGAAGIAASSGGLLTTMGVLGTLLTHPIGWAILAGYAVIGGLVALSGGNQANKDKNHDSALENQAFPQMNAILDDYYHHRRDYASSFDAENSLWNNMASQFVRRDSAITQRPYFDAILKAMAQTEDERNRRRQLLSLQAVPEFASGGWTGMGGPAILHPNEFVMSAQAVQRIGASVLQGLNTAGSSTGLGSSEGMTTIQISTVDLKEAVAKALPVILREGGPASRALRG